MLSILNFYKGVNRSFQTASFIANINNSSIMCTNALYYLTGNDHHIIWIMASLPGPVPTHEIGILVCFSMNYKYFMASFGRSSFFLIAEVSLFHPFKVSYTTSTSLKSNKEAGTTWIDLPLSLYSTATLISERLSKISSLVMLMESYPFTKWVYLTKFKSSHPHLLGLPVVVPNSCPRFLMVSPVLSNNSVGKGPSPTRVVYAFTTPIAVYIFLGSMPRPVQNPPIDVDDEVTYG